MSWSIPTKIEADIQAGLADYKTFQTGMGGQTVLQVPPNAYIVIFGMDYQPSGNGFIEARQFAQVAGNYFPDDQSRFSTQQVSFWTGNQFYPFIFHAPIKLGGVVPNAPVAGQMLLLNYIDSAPIARSLYLPSTNDVTITVGIIKTTQQNTTAAIPVSGATPPGLTYGGSGQVINVQTDFNPTAPQVTQFLQPNPQLFETLGFGLAPAGQSDQAYAKPDFPEGLDDATRVLTAFGIDLVNRAVSNYFMTLHYAIYNSAPNERLL
jgi:hypothetical protein